MKYLKNVYYCSDSFTRSWYGLCNHVARTASVLLLLLTLGVGQMWGSKRVFIDVSWNTDYASKMMVHFWGGTNDSFVWASKYSSDWNYIYYADIDDDATNWQVCRGDALDGTKYNYQYGVTYGDAPHYNMYKVTEWNNSGTASQVIGMVTGGYMYFDNSQTNWSDSYRYFVIGHDSHYNTIGGNTSSNYIANTKLWYFNVQSELWPDARYYAFLSHSGAYPSADKAWLDIDTYGSNKTSQYTSSYSLNDGSIYLCVPSSGTGKPTFTIDYQSALESMNSTQTIQYALSTDNGSSYDVMSSGSTPGTISISAYKFANGTYGSVSNTSNSQSITGNTTGTYSISVPAAYTGETTLSASAATGYTFVGWKIGTTETTASSPCYPTEATTYTARFNANQYSIIYTSPTNGSYTIKAGDASAVSTNVSSVNYATSITLAATPVNGCYVFDSWTVTGATSGETIAVTNNQFSMPDEDVTVTASFVQVNLALDKTPVAGYTNAGNINEVPDKLTDGNNTTAWTTWNSSSSVPASSEWFYVDLGAYYQLSSIEISWEDGGSDYYSTDYLLQVRQTEPTLAEAADDKSWYTAAEETGAVGGGVKRTTVDVPARYVRFHSLSRHGGWLRVWEFRVFGTATTTTYTTPTLNTAEVSSYPLDYETVNLHLASTDSKGAAIHTYKITDENSNVSIVTTNGSDLVTISGLSKFDTHTLTVQAMDNGALLSESQNISVCIWDPSYNMAQGKTVVAGYTNADNTGEAPSKLTDGDTGTMWTTYLNGGSVPASDEWFYVDLGAYYQLSSIELLWGDVYSTDYLLQVRQDAPADASVQADDMQWYPVAEVSDATASSTKSTAVNIPARYVRFHSKTRSGGWLRVCEIRVYTSSFASSDANVPVVATATTSYNNDGKAYLTLTATDTEDVTTNWFRIYNPSTETYSMQQTNVSNQIVIDDLPSCATYTFEVQAMDKAAKLSEVSEIEVKVPVSSLVNLALGKTTYAGYSENGDGSKANAIDGDTGTKWSANGATADENEWFAVDLGKRYDIGKIKVLFGGSGSGDNAAVTPRDFTIQTSLDNVNWADVHHYDSQPTINEWVEKNISKTWAARYVRIWVKEHTTYGMHILELEVYSKYGCYEDDGLIIYHKDDKADDVHADGYEPDGFAGGTIDGIIEYRMKVRAKDQWHALCLPFTVTAVQVWDEDDKAYYDLIPYYRSEGKYYKGHYIIRKPERKLNLPLENFGNWVDPSYQVGFLPQKDTVYIIQWHEDYYVGRYISFFGASGQTIPTSMSVGDAPEVDKVVNLYGNNAMVSGEVTDAYTLVGDYGGGAWLRNDEVGSDREVLPFECYIRANSGTTTIFNAIRRDMTFIDTPTGWDDVVNAEINRQVRVYSITGVMMEQFSDCSINEAAERVRSAYGEGLYILNTENECIQLLVGGK